MKILNIIDGVRFELQAGAIEEIDVAAFNDS